MTDLTAASLFRDVGLMADGPAILGRPMPASRGGVYVVELPAPLPAAPIELTRVGKWIERVPTLHLDGARPTSKQLAARLAAFWIPSSPVLYVGSTSGSIGARLASLDRQVLGDPRPLAAAQWLKTLRVDSLRVWWAATDAPEEYEDALLETFATRIPAAERSALHDNEIVLPFANLRTPTGSRKRHGITGSTLPDEIVPAPPPTTVVELPPGDAEGARREPRNAGSSRRAPKARTAASPPPSTPGPPARKPPPEPVHLTADGLARLRAEHEDLVRRRRPEVIARVKSARELGDLRENSEYAAAREEQSFLEGRIQAIEAQLRTAVVADDATDATRVSIGSRVTVVANGEEVTLTIVGPTESDPDTGRVSTSSPVGRALLGKTEGEEALVRTPGGEVGYRVIAIG